MIDLKRLFGDESAEDCADMAKNKKTEIEEVVASVLENRTAVPFRRPTKEKMAKTYAEKLRDPRWQKKRLEIMERAGFLCERCGGKDKTLNVHHKAYRSKTDPWDYPDALLACLCEDCHEEVSKYTEQLLIAVGDGRFIERVLGYATGHLLGRGSVGSEVPFLDDPDWCRGVIDAWNMPKWSFDSLFQYTSCDMTTLNRAGLVCMKKEVSEVDAARLTADNSDTGHAFAGWWM